MDDLNTVDAIIQKAIKNELFPGAALGIVTESGVTIKKFYGRHTFVPWSRPVDQSSLFDLASLTKPLCTALLVALLVQDQSLSLKQTISDFFPSLTPDKKDITIYHLLTHSSGLDAWMPLYKDIQQRHLKSTNHRLNLACQHILARPLLYKTGTKSVYSDLGFILLAQIIQKVSDDSLWSLAQKKLFFPLKLNNIGSFHEKPPSLTYSVPTGFCPVRNRICWGEVNDLNAWSICSLSGHAGLYSNLGDIIGLLKAIMAGYSGQEIDDFPINPLTIRLFLTNRSKHKSINWGLGFDRPSHKGSTCGEFFSRNSIGHLGYTGTSFWMDLEAKLFVIFLSARTFPFDNTKDKTLMKNFRITLHNEIRKILDSTL